MVSRLVGRAGSNQRTRIRQRDGYQCQACGIAVTIGECDHVISLDHGGSNDESNMRLLCSPCHYEKTCNDMGWTIRGGVDEHGIPISSSHHWSK